MKVMTFNMKNDGLLPFSNWKKRTEGFAELIKKENPDVIGTQEMTYKAKQLLESILIKNNLFYSFYGESRKRNNTTYDEYNCILINNKIKVLDTFTYSLSESPLIPKTKFKNDPFPRIITLVETEKFYIYNTHLTAKYTKNKFLQLDCITKLLKKDKSIIIMGDFNLGNKKLKNFVNENNLIDTTQNIGNTFSTKKALFHLDHILIDNKLSFVNTQKYNFKYENKYISDHYPISTEIKGSQKWESY